MLEKQAQNLHMHSKRLIKMFRLGCTCINMHFTRFVSRNTNLPQLSVVLCTEYHSCTKSDATVPSSRNKLVFPTVGDEPQALLKCSLMLALTSQYTTTLLAMQLCKMLLKHLVARISNLLQPASQAVFEERYHRQLFQRMVAVGETLLFRFRGWLCIPWWVICECSFQFWLIECNDNNP